MGRKIGNGDRSFQSPFLFLPSQHRQEKIMLSQMEKYTFLLVHLCETVFTVSFLAFLGTFQETKETEIGKGNRSFQSLSLFQHTAKSRLQAGLHRQRNITLVYLVEGSSGRNFTLVFHGLHGIFLGERREEK